MLCSIFIVLLSFYHPGFDLIFSLQDRGFCHRRAEFGRVSWPPRLVIVGERTWQQCFGDFPCFASLFGSFFCLFFFCPFRLAFCSGSLQTLINLTRRSWVSLYFLYIFILTLLLQLFQVQFSFHCSIPLGDLGHPISL